MLDVQLLVRVTSSASYKAFKPAHGAAWRSQRLPCSVGAWPDSIREGELAAVVLPLQAGRVGLAAGKQPKPVAMPFIATGASTRPGDYDDIVLAAVLSWLTSAPTGRAVRLSPPVVEEMQRDAVTERRVVEFGRAWSLPRADGI